MMLYNNNLENDIIVKKFIVTNCLILYRVFTNAIEEPMAVSFNLGFSREIRFEEQMIKDKAYNVLWDKAIEMLDDLGYTLERYKDDTLQILNTKQKDKHLRLFKALSIPRLEITYLSVHEYDTKQEFLDFQERNNPRFVCKEHEIALYKDLVKR